MSEINALRQKLQAMEAENTRLKLGMEIIDGYERDLIQGLMDAAGVPVSIDVAGTPSKSLAPRFAWLISDYSALKGAGGEQKWDEYETEELLAIQEELSIAIANKQEPA